MEKFKSFPTNKYALVKQKYYTLRTLWYCKFWQHGTKKEEKKKKTNKTNKHTKRKQKHIHTYTYTPNT